jgi:hypothetical protein
MELWLHSYLLLLWLVMINTEQLHIKNFMWPSPLTHVAVELMPNTRHELANQRLEGMATPSKSLGLLML